MIHVGRVAGVAALALAASVVLELVPRRGESRATTPTVEVTAAGRHDISAPLQLTQGSTLDAPSVDCDDCGLAPPDADRAEAVAPPSGTGRVQGADIEQGVPGTRPPAEITASFDGLGAGFEGPQGTSRFGNPSDNSLAVGPDHIVQTVNSRMAVFTKRGNMFDTTGRVLYGPVVTNAIFKGFGGPCEQRSSGDAVVRYDQLAQRWLYVLPIFQRGTTDSIPVTRLSVPGQAGQPGAAGPPDLIKTPAPPPPTPVPAGQRGQRGAGGQRGQAPPSNKPYSMCYAVSTGADPLGPYYRYEFLRPLFPDYPRPAIWPDGYYVPTSTSDNLIQKHACVVDRARMLRGEPATEQCIVIDGVSFLNNADIEGTAIPPKGAPNIIMAAGGSQLNKRFEDDGIYYWKFHVDWEHPNRTSVLGPMKIAVAPYHFLCDGQLTSCVPQPDTNRRLDAQGDKLMQRLVYRRIGDRRSIVAVHSVNTAAGGGGVRWYEFRLNDRGEPALFQQGTYAPDSLFRWMASPGIDRRGNIAIGYSFGGTPHYAGQRFAARLADDPPGQLTLREAVLVEGKAAQGNTLRWEDYTTTAMDPSDDCTFWYVGDYFKAGATSYSSRIGAFRLPGCT